MPHWMLIVGLILVALFAVVIFTLMFNEMRVKRKTGTMKGRRASGAGADHRQGASRSRKKKRQRGVSR